MVDKFHILYQYRKSQQAASTTDIKTLEQIMVKLRKVVYEQRAEFYEDIGEEATRQVKIEKMRDLMKRDGVCVEDLLLYYLGVG